MGFSERFSDDFFDCGNTVADLGKAALAKGKHSFIDALFPDVCNTCV
jgi:hypothetical protein